MRRTRHQASKVPQLELNGLAIYSFLIALQVGNSRLESFFGELIEPLG
jgi:hypothetical protein